jgi:hypothetical protein
LFTEFLCEHDQCHIAKARVAPLAIVKDFNIFPDRRFRLGSGDIPVMVHQFVL